jgi:MinD-like ATPase involved in chromosome partitioning or flagellar assembly
MQPRDALSERFDVLLIDDICSFLSPYLVQKLKGVGRRVVGVYDPVEFPDGKDRLLACDVTEVIEADADPEEFLALVEQLGVTTNTSGLEPVDPGDSASTAPNPVRLRPLVAVGSPPGGCGATEVAIGLSRRFAERYEGVGLLDLDQRAPSIAQRLGLGLHPNLLTAIDAVHHRSDTFESCWHSLPASSMRILPGVPNPTDRANLRRGEVAEVLLEATTGTDLTVVNLGFWDAAVNDQPFWDTTGNLFDSVLEVARVVVGVALPTPVGIVRMIEWIGRVRAAQPGVSHHVVINRTPGSPSVRRALFDEVTAALGQLPILFLPEDSRVSEAAWNGVLVERGKFRKGCDRLADLLLPEVVEGD